MLPVPFIKHLPKAAKEGDDAGRDALVDKADAHVSAWSDETKILLESYRVEKVSAIVLDEMADQMAVSIFSGDTERMKRAKIASAIPGHKRRASFPLDIKPTIDIIVGADCQIVNEILGPQFVWANSEDDIPVGAEWVLWDNGLGDNGMVWSGGEFESTVAGIASIDVGRSDLSSEELSQVVEAVSVVVPAYYRVILGYFASGAFTPYVGGTIG